MSYASKVFPQLFSNDCVDVRKIIELGGEIRTKPIPPSLSYDSYKSLDKTQFGVLQDTVMKNFVLTLEEAGLLRDPEYIKSLEPLFLPQDINPTTEARLFAALHATKVDNFNYENLLTIELVTPGDINGVSLADLKDWAKKYLSHPRGIKVIKNLVKDSDGVPFELTNLVLDVQFFTCNDPNLWAFSGVGILYFNVHAFTAALEQVKANVPQDYKDQPKQALKLAIAAVGFHESAFMAIRKALNNANLSWVDRLKHGYNYCYTLEPGVLAQTLLFKLPPPHWFRCILKSRMEEMVAFAENKSAKFPRNFDVPVNDQLNFCFGMYQVGKREAEIM